MREYRKNYNKEDVGYTHLKHDCLLETNCMCGISFIVVRHVYNECNLGGTEGKLGCQCVNYIVGIIDVEGVEFSAFWW